uniref:Uncharacterized protein LOC108949781 n=1 Tax=Phallusia mammillata TaxID=59560 RepID=A0A6F9DJV7_9ASCI|nr:uncharacterized protein LOC108949781 [Phallusia mammillata]
MVQIKAQLVQILRAANRVEKKFDAFTSKQEEVCFQTFSPAKNDNELNTLLENVKDCAQIAKRIEREDLRSTVRSFVRLFMTRELAMKFSWTGLGPKRQHTKQVFKGHKLKELLLHVLQFTCYKHATIDIVEKAIKVTLAEAVDWDGGREERRNNITTPLKENDSDTDEDTEPCEED